MKVLIISGSAREGSATFRVAQALQSQIKESSIIDFKEYDLPAFNDDLSKLGESDFQKSLIDGMNEAHMVLVLTPEYNWFPSAEVINMVHLLGGDNFKHVFDNSVFAFVGISAGRGGRMPAVQLGYVFNKVIQYFNLSSVVSPKSFESQETFKCIDANGNLLQNDEYNSGLIQFVEYNINLANRWHQIS